MEELSAALNIRLPAFNFLTNVPVRAVPNSLDRLLSPYRFEEFQQFYFANAPFLKPKTGSSSSNSHPIAGPEEISVLRADFVEKFGPEVELQPWGYGDPVMKNDWRMVQHHTFLIQTSGSSNIYLKDVRNIEKAPEGLRPLTSVSTLKAGEWLYVPTGWMKKTIPLPKSSGIVIRVKVKSLNLI